MVLTLYMDDASPGVRAVKMAAEILGLQMTEKFVDLAKLEHFNPEYLKRSPAHTIPSLDDNGFIVNDSHAINTYLVTKYGKDDSLYPKDAQKRSKVDFVLYYDASILFPCVYQMAVEIYFGKNEFPTEGDIAKVNSALDILERVLTGRSFAAGDELSVGDLSLIASLSSLNYLVPIQVNQHPKVKAYLNKMMEQPFYSINAKGLEKHIGYLEQYRKLHFHK